MADEEKKADELAEEKQEDTKAEDTKAEDQKTEEEKKAEKSEEEELPSDILEMTEEELDKASDKMIDDETGEIKEPEIKTDEEKAAEAEAKAAEDAEKAKKEEDGKKKEDEPEKKYDVHGNEISGDPLRDTQAELQRERDARGTAERKLEEERFKGFEKLNEDDEGLLKEEDPDGYLVYKERERDFEKHTADLLDDDIHTAHASNRDSVINFMAGRLDLDPNKPSDQERIIALMRNPDTEESKLMVKLDNYLSANVKPVKSVKVSEKDAIPVYSTDQLNQAYTTVYHDDIIATKEKAAREATLNEIEAAEKGGSKFDRLGKSDEKPSGQKKIDDYTQSEINNMTEEETDRLLQQVDNG